MRVFRGEQGFWAHDQAIADLNLGGLGLRRPAAPRPLFGGADGFHMIVEHMRAPARCAAPPSLAAAFVVADGRFGVGCTGKPAGFHALDARRHARPLWLGRRHTPWLLAGLTGSSGRPENGSLPRRDARPRTPRARDGRHFAHASIAVAPDGSIQVFRATRVISRAAGPTPLPPGVPHTYAAPT